MHLLRIDAATFGFFAVGRKTPRKTALRVPLRYLARSLRSAFRLIGRSANLK